MKRKSFVSVVMCASIVSLAAIADEGLRKRGYVTTDFGPYNTIDVANAAAVQTDGKVISAGSTREQIQAAMARHLSNGVLDTTFGAAGMVTFSLGYHTSINAVAL